MRPIGYYLGISKQTEVILLTLIGICYTIFDPSLLDLHSNLQKLWQVALDPNKIAPRLQIYIKYILSLIVLVRTFSVHIYLAFYIVMLWPAFLEERPALLLPWLIVGAIKCLGMGVLAFVSGIYVCYAYGIRESICLDFILAQIIDYAPSFYMWYCVYSFYCDLKVSAITAATDNRSVDIETQIALRRRKVRTLADDVAMRNAYAIDEDRNLISVSTIEDLVQHLTTDINRKASRSFDSLLTVMAAEAEKEELMNSCNDPFTDIIGLPLKEKTMKLLKISETDVLKARERVKQHIELFTNSMLNLSNEDSYEVSTNTNMPSESTTLPTIRIEKKDSKVIHLHRRKRKNTSLTPSADASETQIGSVLDYSFPVILLSDSDTVPSKKPNSQTHDSNLKNTLKQDLQNKGNKTCNKNQSVFINKYDTNESIKKQSNTVNKEKTKKINTYVPTGKALLDFTCQASTLSKNILQSSNLKCLQGQSKTTTDKGFSSQKTPYMKASDKNITAKRSKYNTSKNQVKFNSEKKSLPHETTGEKSRKQRLNSPFRQDGYSLAYDEKLRKAKTAEKPLVIYQCN